jgi:PAT family beta-lactamase induction signal transducer AmpG
LVLLGLAGMAWWQPSGGLTQFALLALLVAFASATQDIVIDAWRIESAANGEEQGLLTSTAQLGYRGALLVTDSLILILAAWQGWAISYWLMAALMGLGIAATVLAAEPARHAPQQAAIWSARGLWDAVVGPFIDFFRTHRQWALLMLVAVSLYRLPDFMMGPMANPFYADLGLAKEVVGGMRSSIGLVATLIGIAAGGLAALRLGFVPTLLAGAILGPASNLAFTAMALLGPSLEVFAVALSVDNFATGFAGAALVAYMSSLTTQGYTITQYALLSSFYALPGKFLKGFSGALVEYWQGIYGAMGGYAAFFAFTAALGLPALLLVAVLAKQLRQGKA